MGNNPEITIDKNSMKKSSININEELKETENNASQE
jgi:hypothetical protein